MKFRLRTASLMIAITLSAGSCSGSNESIVPTAAPEPIEITDAATSPAASLEEHLQEYLEDYEPGSLDPASRPDPVPGTAQVLSTMAAILGVDTEVGQIVTDWTPDEETVLAIDATILSNPSLDWVTEEHARFYSGYVEDGERRIRVNLLKGVVLSDAELVEGLRSLAFWATVNDPGSVFGLATYSAGGDYIASTYFGAQ